MHVKFDLFKNREHSGLLLILQILIYFRKPNSLNIYVPGVMGCPDVAQEGTMEEDINGKLRPLYLSLRWTLRACPK